MPDATSQLNTVGSISKALLNALDQIERYVAASQLGPDGKPLGTAIYMHMPTGYPIDPKMFANAWTPGGGDSSSSFSNDGTFVQPTAKPSTGVASGGTGPAGSMYPPPTPAPDQKLENSIQNAWFTSMLVDQMLEVTKNGVATAWPDRKVSVEYYTILKGMQPVPIAQPSQDVLDAVAAAQNLLYLKDDKGNFVGYTQLYNQYRHNRTTWENAVAAQASAYAQAMSDPVAGQVWPTVARKYANDVQLALDDFNNMGRRQVEDAINTIATQGEGAAAALCALAQQMYDAYAIQLGGQVSVDVPWSFISPISWWDYTDQSFGVQKITATSEAHDKTTESGTGSFASNWQKQQSESTSGSGGVNFGIAGAGASVSHADASNAFANHANQYNWTTHADNSSSASVSLEFFLATIERPWLLGDIFNIGGWYVVGQRKNCISDGTIENQIGEKSPAILPMLPKAFLIIRNVQITCDDWGDAGRQLSTAQQNAAGSGESSSNSVGVQAHYLFYTASGQHDDQQSSGAFSSGNTSSGFSFESDGKKGGTLTLMGSQIAGWVGQIQLAAPQMDDPTLPKLTDKGKAAAMATGPVPPASPSRPQQQPAPGP